MTNEMKMAEEMLTENQLDEISGGASVKSWVKAIGGTAIGVGATVAAIRTGDPAIVGVAIVSLALGVQGIIEVAQG